VAGAPPEGEQTLVMAGQLCEDGLQLKHYGVCENWIAQVTGFVLNPSDAGCKFIDGHLVALDTPDPDWDSYPATETEPVSHGPETLTATGLQA
jgi:hypothetical protein